MDTVSNVVTCIRLLFRIKTILLPQKPLKTAGDRIKTAGMKNETIPVDIGHDATKHVLSGFVWILWQKVPNK